MENRRKKSLDFSVIFVFMIVSAISVAFMAMKMLNRVDCSSVNFAINASDFTQGKIIYFEDMTPKAKSWEWDFGDGSTGATEKNVLHIFKFPGKYEVKLYVNGVCKQVRSIEIKGIKTEPAVVPYFSVPAYAEVGKPVKFYDSTANAKTWEWRFGENFDDVSRLRDPVYVYTTPGIKTVILIIDGKKAWPGKKEIMVLSKPVKEPRARRYVPEPSVRRNRVQPQVQAPVMPEVKPPVALAPEINESEFRKILNLIGNGERKTDTLSSFVCKNLDIPITFSNIRARSAKTTTLRKFCQEMKGKKVTAVEITRDERTKCITSLEVVYKFSDW
jgi:hypothetical protein